MTLREIIAAIDTDDPAATLDALPGVDTRWFRTDALGGWHGVSLPAFGLAGYGGTPDMAAFDLVRVGRVELENEGGEA